MYEYRTGIRHFGFSAGRNRIDSNHSKKDKGLNVDEKVTFVPCAFINSMDKPERIGQWRGFGVAENHDKEQSISLSGNREYYYRHPEAPDVALITVYRSDHLMSAQPGDQYYPALYMLLQAQKVVEQLVKEQNNETN